MCYNCVNFSQIIGWLKDTAVTNSDMVEMVKIGESYEGRDLIVMKVNDNVTGW